MNLSKVSTTLRKILPLQYCGAVIVAAGNASRMGGIDKVMAPLGGAPMIVRTVRAFQDAVAIKEIVVVTRPDLIAQIQQLCAGFDKVTAVVAGGSDRQESVEKGLKALSDKVKLAAIQDGARPLITEAVIDRTVRAAHTYGAAAPAIPVKDTIKIENGGIVEYDHCNVGHTVALPDRTFCNCTTDCRRSAAEFLPYARACQEEAVKHTGFVNQEEDESGMIFTSCVPWVRFTQVVQPTPIPADSNPRIVMGKYFKDGEKTMMPLHIQCNHALVDGWHVGEFYRIFEELEKSL